MNSTDICSGVLLSIKPKKSLTGGFASVTVYGIGLQASPIILEIFRGPSSNNSSDYLPVVQERFDNSRISFSAPGPKQDLFYFSSLTGNGLCATFYQSAELLLPRSSRIVPDIDFSFAYREPLPGSLEYGASSIRWSGLLKSDAPALYTIQLSTLDVDERVRLWVDNALLIDSWDSLTSQEETALFRFSSNKYHYDIKVEYQQTSGSFGLKLLWSTNSQVQTIIPHENLYPPGDFHEATVSLASERQGIFATYYNLDGQEPLHAVWYPEPVLDISLQKPGIGAIRWEGFLKPSFSEVYTFTVALNHARDRIEVWIDQAILLQQWQSLDTAALEGTIFFDSATRAYQIEIFYKPAQDKSYFELYWKSNLQMYSRVDKQFYLPCLPELYDDTQRQEV